MPRGDGTGPAGMGPMMGRAAVFCAGYSVPGYGNQVGGRGCGFFGRGRGGGRGRRNWFFATGMPGWARAGAGYPAWGGYGSAAPVGDVTVEQELAGLKQQAEYMGNALGEINKRIEELEAQSAK